MASNKAQILAKVITSILLASIAFLIGKEGYTAATVGDLQGADKTVGVIVLLVCAAAILIIAIKYKNMER